MDGDDTKADAPLTPDEERALREAWAHIGSWEPRDGQEPGATYECPLCNGEGETEGVILDAAKPFAATLHPCGTGPGLAAAELVAGSTGRLLATVDTARLERDEAVEALAKLEAEIVEVRREKTELAARVDGAVAKADLLRDVARHERNVYAHVIARLRAALRLDAGAAISDVAKRAEELAALQVGTP